MCLMMFFESSDILQDEIVRVDNCGISHCQQQIKVPETRFHDFSKKCLQLQQCGNKYCLSCTNEATNSALVAAMWQQIVS